MATTPLVFIILSSVYIVCYLIMAIFLIVRAKKTELKNLNYLAIAFLALIWDFILINFIKIPWLTNIFVNFGFIMLVLFTNKTFYSGIQKTYLALIGIMIVLKISDFIIRWSNPFTTPLTYELPESQIPIFWLWFIIVRLTSFLPLLWLLISVWKSYISLRSQDIELWIKWRYILLGFGTFIYILQNPILFFLPTDGTAYTGDRGFRLGLLLLIMYLTFALTFLAAWVMPSKLKKFFNKNYISKSASSDFDLSEEDLLKQLEEDDH